MGCITELPVEVHIIILRYLRILSPQEHFSDFENSVRDFISRHRPPDAHFGQREPYTNMIYLFPYNAALTCVLWRDILAGIPDLWNSIIFDLSINPLPLIDVFEWTENPNLDVLVFTSVISDAEVDRMRERKRAATIAQALQPHIRYCTAINFHTTFASSLPKPTLFFSQDAPFLESISVDSWTDDMDMAYTFPENVSISVSEVLSTNFPSLRNIKMAGIVFMELCVRQGGSEWFKDLRASFSALNVEISRFGFQDGSKSHGYYTVEKFASCLSQIRRINKLRLFDLSLGFKSMEGPPVETCCKILPTNLHFESVSKDFLHVFARYASCDALKDFQCTSCTIPKIFPTNITANKLTLDNINFDSPEEENSLQNILAVWTGKILNLRSCSTFNDGLLEWLGLESGDLGALTSMFPARNMWSMYLSNCTNYSIGSLRRLVEIRNLHGTFSMHNMDTFKPLVIQNIFIDGRRPALEKELAWIDENNFRISFNAFRAMPSNIETELICLQFENDC